MGTVSVATALALLPTNRLWADSKATDHFERGIQDPILALFTCSLERRRSGCVAAMFHQCPQRGFWPPRRGPALGSQAAGSGKSQVAVDTNAISVEQALGCPVPSGMGEGNNSPVGAGGATRLTGLNPGARLTK